MCELDNKNKAKAKLGIVLYGDKFGKCWWCKYSENYKCTRGSQSNRVYITDHLAINVCWKPREEVWKSDYQYGN